MTNLVRCITIHHVTNDLLTTRQAADRLGVTVSTISRWVASGKLAPALRIEGLRGPMWFRPADVDALAKAAAS